MGVDSGLPDFRGTQGFWRAYPPYERLGLDFVSLGQPALVRRRSHTGLGLLRTPHGTVSANRTPRGLWNPPALGRRDAHGGFVFTSNVDGHFQRAGFDPERIVEVHGSFDGMQCMDACGIGIFSGDAFEVEINAETMRAVPPLPACPSCGALARPNICMFGDWGWDPSRTDCQLRRLTSWIDSLGEARLVVVECGAGVAVPSVRNASHKIAGHGGGTLVRINPASRTFLTAISLCRWVPWPRSAPLMPGSPQRRQ